ncbi:exported hypothetical protein [Mesorhizobium sp. ORS 3324]|nr:exported hypothetical protein [Mesorhizobium sp. ORS 3324]
MVFLKTCVTILGALIYCTGAYAAKGDHLRCSVDDFFATKAGSVNYDESFVEQNKNKSFEIYEFTDKFTVISKSSFYNDSSTDYKIIKKGILETTSVALSSTIESLSVSNIRQERDANLIHASIGTLSPQYSNIWYLLCILGD